MVTARLSSFLDSPPSPHAVKRGMVRKADAVTILDVVSPDRHVRKPHETPFAGDCTAPFRCRLVLRWLVSETLLKFLVLVSGFIANLAVVSLVSFLGGVTPLKADSRRDRIVRVRRERERRRDRVRRFLKGAFRGEGEDELGFRSFKGEDEFPFKGCWGEENRER